MKDSCDFCMISPHEYKYGIFNLCVSCFQYYIDEDENDFDSDYDSDDEVSEAETIVVT